MPNSSDKNDIPPIGVTNEQLVDEALLFCRQLHDNPQDERLLGRVHQWQARSEMHRASWQRAHQLWQASAKIKPQFVDSNLLSRWTLAFQIKREVLCEAFGRRPLALAPPVLVTCLLLLAILFNESIFVTNDSVGQPLAAVAETSTRFQTRWQELRELKLDDGTVVHMNWDSDISVSINAQQRRVVLHRGEANFIVATDKQRPFTVSVQGVSATAIGTEFVVQRAGYNEAIVTVGEGIVEVNASDSSAAPVRLTQNQQITSSATTVSDIESVDASDVGAWQRGMLVFNKRPLLQVLAELDRYTQATIEPGLIFDTNRHVTGTYFTDRADDALALIALAFDLELKLRAGNRVVVDSARAQRPS